MIHPPTRTIHLSWQKIVGLQRPIKAQIPSKILIIFGKIKLFTQVKGVFCRRNQIEVLTGRNMERIGRIIRNDGIIVSFGTIHSLLPIFTHYDNQRSHEMTNPAGTPSGAYLGYLLQTFFKST
jgi:hypothetical protein